MPRHSIAHNPRLAEAWFRSRLKHWWPKAESLASLRLERVGSVQPRRGIVRYTLSLRQDGRRRVVVVYGNYSPSSESRHIFNTLQLAWRHGFSRGLYRVPRPLTFLPTERLLLYQEYPGRRVRDVLQDGRLSLAQSRGVVIHTAKWLRQFHALPVRTGRKIPGVLRLRDFRHLAPLHGWPWPAVLAAVNRRLGQATRRSPRAMVHGDPHLANAVIGSDRSFSLIDYSESHCGHPLYDVGMFLVHLDAALRPFFRPPEIARLQQAFVSTYFGSKVRAQRAANDLMVFQVRTALDFYKFTVPRHRRASPYVRWMVRRWADMIDRFMRSRGATKS